jgi:hypothetical protein
MSAGWRHALVALTAIVVVAVWPLTPAVSSGDALQARLGAAVVAAMACALLAAIKRWRPGISIALSIGSAAAGVVLLFAHFDALASCVAEYDGRPMIVGREYARDAASYVTANPGLAASDRLLDAGGVPERVWSAESIRSCRRWASWGGTATVPLFAVSVAALLSRARPRLLPRRASVPPAAGAPAGTLAYDAFISYRHTEPDRTQAIEILESLERRGLRVAIDFRDFAANEHFLSEMERCIRQSRYVLCVITAQYLTSDHTSEEAIISKTLDMADRRKRLVPLVFERVELPVWLHGLVGIDFTESASIEPTERLVSLLARNVPPFDRPPSGQP